MTPTAMVTTDTEAMEDTITLAMETMVDMVSRIMEQIARIPSSVFLGDHHYLGLNEEIVTKDVVFVYTLN